MDPSLYSDSYKRYKIGTNYIASWLVETAKSCGATLDFLCLETHNQPVEISNGSKQKGKKLKAKHKGKESGSCKVPVGQFVRLATIIAETAQGKGVKVEIPRSVLQIGKEVIALRMRCSSFFSTQALSDELIQEKNGSHMHFIGVFEEVVRILESCPTPSSSAQNKTKEGKYSVKLQGDLVNSFEVLELEETNPSFEEASTEPRTAHSKPTSATGAPLKKPLYEVEAEPSGNELLFSLFCFFQDVNEVRTFIKDTWAQFRDGEIDLASAAITTDITIDLIYQKEKEFLDAITIPKHFKPLYLGIGNILLSVIRQSHKEDPECAALLTDRVDTVVMDMADWLFVSPCSHLEDFKALAAEGPTPVMEGGTPMMDNVRDTWEDGSPVETIPTSIKYEDDKMLLFNRLDDILLLIHTGIEPPALDKVTIGLRALLINEQKVSVGLAFALQTFIDIQDILGQDIEVGFRTLCESGKRATAQLQEYFQYSRNMRKDDSPWPDFANQNLLRVLSVITNWTKKDPLSMTATELTGQFYPDRQLLRNHPLLCGLITFHIDLVMWEGGMQMSNAWQSILNWAHLYNAVKQELGCEEWQDMEFLIGEHNAKHLFFGGLPTKPEEYEKRWSLAMGISAQVSASNRRSKESVFARGRACVRPLRLDSMVSEIIGGRYRTMGNLWVKEGHDMHKSLNFRAVLTEFAKRPQNALIRRDGEAVTAVQLLEALRNGLAKESAHLHFDYFRMHQRCWDLLQRVLAVLGEDDLNVIGAIVDRPITMLLSHEKYVVMLSSFLLHVVAFNAKLSKKQASLPHTQAAKGILPKVKTVMEECIRRGEGGVEIAKAETAKLLNPKRALSTPDDVTEPAGDQDA